jgi:FAD synthetase
MKNILASIWSRALMNEAASLGSLKTDLEKCGIKDVEERLAGLKDDGFAVETETGFVLTPRGRGKIKVTVCGGVFDILHPGHAFILNEAKAIGDVLVVIVARDSTVEKRKRIPIVPQDQRVDMVAQFKPVDVCVLGYEGDPLKIIEEIRPDVIALGPDQHHDEKRIKDEMSKRGVSLEVKRIMEFKDCELNSTKAILQQIIERGYPVS